MLISVVFPEPEGPMSATHSPVFTSKLTPPSARSVPYCLIKSSMTTCFAAMSGGAATTELTLHPGKPRPGGCWPAARPRFSGVKREYRHDDCQSHRYRIHNQSRPRRDTKDCFA